MKLSEFIASLDEEERFRFDERCGIREHQGGMTRKDAEMMTAKEMQKKQQERGKK